ncbi:MAG: NADH:flavin oxidoreductase [Planctomycetota bacterium]|nr:MAG: NADH:flavin oxidoreductase [Planctomycetota bacterium]
MKGTAVGSSSAGGTLRRIGGLKDVGEFRAYLEALDVDLPVEEVVQSAADRSPMAWPIVVGGFRVGNRWCIQPMEGWDGTREGAPSEHTLRRWRHFGESGAKLIWGGEAVAVRHDGRANPNQLCVRHPRGENTDALRRLRRTLEAAHCERFGRTACDDLLVGLQLTHSGRFARPNEKFRPEPRIAYHHPLLDPRVGIRPDDETVVLSDGEVRELIDDFVRAARAAAEAGFRFVDIKHCHGYLGHEFLSAFDRPGPYGGDLDGRSRFLREIIEGIRAECPDLLIGVRLSVFDMPPFRRDPRADGRGVPVEARRTRLPTFGYCAPDSRTPDLTEPIALIRRLRDEYGVTLFNISAGSPYYNPHIQRPAFYPPSDGYRPPEDPLLGCVRQIDAVRRLKRELPGVVLVGSAYSYFQEFLPHVAQGMVRTGNVDFVGLGRMVLSYWELPADVLAGRPLKKNRLCRTFSDCTTAPRNGLISGCYPLDPYYKRLPEMVQLQQIKRRLRQGD